MRRVPALDDSGLTGTSLRTFAGPRRAVAVLAVALALEGCSLSRFVPGGVAGPEGKPDSSGNTRAVPAGPAQQLLASLPPVPEVWQTWPQEQPLFPMLRLVGFAGYPGARSQGRLGIGKLDERVGEIVQLGNQYKGDGRRIMPTLELIAITVQSDPGKDGKFRIRAPQQVIRDHVAAARKVGGMVLLNIQPGRADFLTEAKALETWLTQPDVGLALDPEWRMGSREIPMQVFGHVSGQELNSVSEYLSQLVATYRLPPKVMLFHQLNAKIVRAQAALQPHPGVVAMKTVDGIGSAEMKLDTWKKLTAGMPAQFRAGFKLFYEEDRRHGPLMTPKQVMSLTPKVDYVLYE